MMVPPKRVLVLLGLAALLLFGWAMGWFGRGAVERKVVNSLKAKIALLSSSQVVSVPTWWNAPVVVKHDTTIRYTTDPKLAAELAEWRRRAGAAEEKATLWQALFWQRETLPGSVGVVSDPCVADTLMHTWAVKSLDYRDGQLRYFAFLTPAIVKSGKFDLRGARRWSVVGTPNGLTVQRRRKFLGSDWGAFLSAQGASEPDLFAPSFAARVGLYGERGPVEWSAGWHQPAAPVALGRVFGEVRIKARF